MPCLQDPASRISEQSQVQSFQSVDRTILRLPSVTEPGSGSADSKRDYLKTSQRYRLISKKTEASKLPTQLSPPPLKTETLSMKTSDLLNLSEIFGQRSYP